MPTPLGVTLPEQASYMLRAAAGNAGRAYKQHLIDLLDIAPGQTVLDVGCGPGTDRVLMHVEEPDAALALSEPASWPAADVVVVPAFG